MGSPLSPSSQAPPTLVNRLLRRKGRTRGRSALGEDLAREVHALHVVARSHVPHRVRRGDEEPGEGALAHLVDPLEIDDGAGRDSRGHGRLQRPVRARGVDELPALCRRAVRLVLDLVDLSRVGHPGDPGDVADRSRGAAPLGSYTHGDRPGGGQGGATARLARTRVTRVPVLVARVRRADRRHEQREGQAEVQPASGVRPQLCHSRTSRAQTLRTGAAAGKPREEVEYWTR